MHALQGHLNTSYHDTAHQGSHLGRHTRERASPYLHPFLSSYPKSQITVLLAGPTELVLGH